MPDNKVFVGGAWRTVTRRMVFLGGAWRTITRRKVYKGAAWHDGPTYLGALSVSISPDPAIANGRSASPVYVEASPITATPSGGLAPYTYSWAIVSADPGFSLTSTNTASTGGGAAVAPDAEVNATISVTVTDSVGSTAQATSTVTLRNRTIGIGLGVPS